MSPKLFGRKGRHSCAFPCLSWPKTFIKWKHDTRALRSVQCGATSAPHQLVWSLAAQRQCARFGSLTLAREMGQGFTLVPTDPTTSAVEDQASPRVSACQHRLSSNQEHESLLLRQMPQNHRKLKIRMNKTVRTTHGSPKASRPSQASLLSVAFASI